MTLENLIALALAEDLGDRGDVTTQAVLRGGLEQLEPGNGTRLNPRGRGRIVAKQDLVLSGTPVIAATFNSLLQARNERALIALIEADGAHVKKGALVGTVEAPLDALLSGERVMLNLLMHLSGIASFTRACVQALGSSKCRLLDTRKTLPLLRALEKQAVHDGGGANHRFGLFDGLLIKDNHITAAGSLAAAVKAAKAAAGHLMKVECEVKNSAEVEQAIDAGAEVLLLDNMNDAEVAASVRLIAGRARTEASGNVTLARLPTLAATGVDFISMGSLTHSAPAADLSMKIEVLSA